MAADEQKDEPMADPVSSAIALAGRGAAEVATPKLRELLLGRLAKAYGDHWGEQAEDRLRQRREERRLKNAYSHIQTVALLNPKRAYEEVSEDPLFDEWLTGAAAVDPEVDPELADFWRAALLALAKGDITRLRLLRMVKLLGPDDAAFLATGRVSHRRFRPAPDFADEQAYTRRAEQAGVFESPWHEFRRRPVAIVTTIAMPLFVYAMLTLWPYWFPDKRVEPDAVTSLAIPGALLAFALAMVVLLQQFLGSVRRLTPDGARLMSLLDQIRLLNSDSHTRSGMEAGIPPWHEDAKDGGPAGEEADTADKP